MEGSRLVTSVKVDPDGIDELAAGELAAGVLALADELADLRSGSAAATGVGPLDRVLAELWSTMEQGLGELGSALRGHGLAAVAASAGYRRVELAQAAGR
ncbi:MAG: hypothetical protein M3Y42_17745 [Actinomycetota bacterium]|nr:hypothetical protein [Actinomycetota bacterium]